MFTTVVFIKKYFISAIYFNFLVSCFAAANENNTDKQHPGNSLVALPYAFYTQETQTAAGIGAIYSFRSQHAILNARPSTLKLAGTYTQRK